MKVQGYVLPQVAVADVHTSLYLHQAAMLHEWEDHNAFVLLTKTGSGKTRAVTLPILKRRESAVFVYPTNALIADQARAIQELLRDEGVSYREWTPENADEQFDNAEYLLVQLSSDSLEEFRRAWGRTRKGDALERLLRADKRQIILVNPDVLFLLFSLQYRKAGASIAALQNITTAVFDEFHLYTGVELAHALFMIYLAREMGMFRRIALLSATPDEEVMKYLNALFKPRVIEATEPVQDTIIGTRVVAHDVELLPLPTSREDAIDAGCRKILELANELQQLRSANAEANARGEYVPCVVILNSVVNAIVLEDQLVEGGITRQDIAPIRGLSARSARNLRGKLIVIGTSAIEVGIDFQADYLVFEAGDIRSFVQRFGRIGRHRMGKALLLCNYREEEALNSLGHEISRDLLEQKTRSIYPQRDSHAWFVSTSFGMVSICAQAHNFKQKILEDWSAEEARRSRINQWVDDRLAGYAQALGTERFLHQAILKLKRPWFLDYAKIDSFRTSLPSQEVWDKSEEKRGRSPKYDTDVKTLLTRADRLWSSNGRLYVSGYGAWKDVWFFKSFEDVPERVGSIETTTEYPPDEMLFIRQGRPTPVSDVMYKPDHHIFCFVPYELTNMLDWRIAWFHCGDKRGRYIIAFDGDALLLREIYFRSRSSIDAH